jgi:hypothetical protein
VKIVLIPQPRLRLGIGGPAGIRYVLDVVAGATDEPRDALRPQRRHHTGRAAAPVVSRQHRLLDVKRIEQLLEVPPKCGLFAGTQRLRGQEPRAPIAAQIRNDGAKARGVDDGHDFIEAARIIGKAM